MKNFLIQLVQFLCVTSLCCSLPLSTNSRWIVDESSGERVKLACTNWAGHLEPMLAEGLDKKAVGDIAGHVKEMGYNCVRLTWATYMFTRHAGTTVARSFASLGLEDAADGIARYNPGLLNLSVVDAQRAVVKEIVGKGLMVVLDNHVSRPMWCCRDDDGNGFFGDTDFDANEWLHALRMVATRYRDTPMVVGMSLRNELRGALQNTSLWHKYIVKGAKAIHKGNPKLLVIVSGLHYDLSFEFLKKKPLKKNFKNKLVYEVHRYAFSSGLRNLWFDQPFNRACDVITRQIQKEAGFLVEGQNGVPLFASEFGTKQLEMGRAETLFLGCFLGYLAEMDLDWSVWALQGSYYMRDGVHGLDETYGMLNSDWTTIRNPDFHRQLHLIQQKIQDPMSKDPTYHILYHPLSGQCIRSENSEVYVGDCSSGMSRWNHPNGIGNGNPIQLRDTDTDTDTELCLSASGDGIPVTLSRDCSSRTSQWELLSSSRFQVANRDEDGNYLCLDWDPNNSSRVLTNKCFCLHSDNCLQSPQTQWFKLISANLRLDNH